MLASEKIAIAAHLHVLLRRKTGRVTDTEWMAENLEYAQAVVKFARQKALEDGHADLAEWAEKLERAVHAPAPATRVPLAQHAANLLRATPAPPAAAAAAAVPAPSRTSITQPMPLHEPPPVAPAATPAPAVPRYIGGIR